MVERPTEKPPGAIQTIQTPGVAVSTFQCRLSCSVCTARVCAVAFINISVHVNNINHWLADTALFGHTNILHSLMGMSSAALAAAVLYPGKATRIFSQGLTMMCVCVCVCVCVCACVRACVRACVCYCQCWWLMPLESTVFEPQILVVITRPPSFTRLHSPFSQPIVGRTIRGCLHVNDALWPQELSKLLWYEVCAIITQQHVRKPMLCKNLSTSEWSLLTSSASRRQLRTIWKRHWRLQKASVSPLKGPAQSTWIRFRWLYGCSGATTGACWCSRQVVH